jgi:hypothetical protein
MDGLYGANIGAGTAVGAKIGIDLVNIAFDNRLNGAFIYAGTACCTIFCNYVSHFSII